MNEQLNRISKAYDITVTRYRAGSDPYDSVPEEIKAMPGYSEIVCNRVTGSGAPDIKEYLNPKSGMYYLDAGCCANLVNYHLYEWPSVYYGVDISPALIEAMKAFVQKKRISIGGLYHTDIACLPFNQGYFDIASVIGVLEYCTLDYAQSAISELARVLKHDARMVLDIPNLEHPYVATMFKLEEYFGRPNIPNERPEFEALFNDSFTVGRIDDSMVMLKFFVRRK